jgi:DNA-binding CsgD family transcriptional regulator
MGNLINQFFGILTGLVIWLLIPGYTTARSVKNFPKSVYGAANQNWSTDTGTNGFIYFANHKGLLEFDGAGWKLMTLPNETILRAVLADSDSIIYSAGYREFGFWKTGTGQQLHYTSLNYLAEPLFSKNEEFWNIAQLDDKIFFQSFAKILMYNGKAIKPIGFPGFVNTMKKVNDQILVAVNGHGIFAMKDTVPELLISDPVINHSIVRFILPYDETQVLIGTASQGIFLWNGSNLRTWLPEWNNYFRANEVNRAHITPSGEIIIGTIIDGITIFNREGNLTGKFDTSNGLQNNTILGITCDTFGNIWLALDNGIDFISADTSHSVDFDLIGDAGSVYDIAFSGNRIYLGTNQGLFFKDISNPEQPFELVPQAQGQVWFCKVINGILLAGYNGGLIALHNNQPERVSDQAGAFSIREDPMIRESYVVSTYSNLIRVRFENGRFMQEKAIHGFFDLIRYIEFDHRGNLWASHMHRGIYRLQLNTGRDSIINETYYGKNTPFGKDHSIHVFRIENRIVFTTGDSLFTYDDIRDSIVPYSSLNKTLGRFAAANRIIEADGHHYWIITKKEIGLFRIQNNEAEMVSFFPRTILGPNAMIDDFENLYPLGENKAIVCLENGIATLNYKDIANSPIGLYKPSLREITLSGPRVAKVNITPDEGVIEIRNKYQTIRINYSFPHYTHFPVNFIARLEGIDSGWSEPRNEPVFTFDRLPVGTYQLMVKASDPWGNESQQETITLKILPPWYLSSFIKKVYVVLILLLFFGLQAWGIKRTRKKAQQHLENREKELIRLRNEKLRDEVEFKSKELVNLTMAIVKKNEFLMDLKEIFTRQKEQLGSRYPDKYYNDINRKIDENISNHDDWNLFETNFERAHEQFLLKLKQMFPELTPKDLRLSAFLRMNLSSKEIAPLLGISVRGVENHRYRLRKKMGLDHDDNLIEMILKL